MGKIWPTPHPLSFVKISKAQLPSLYKEGGSFNYVHATYLFLIAPENIKLFSGGIEQDHWLEMGQVS